MAQTPSVLRAVCLAAGDAPVNRGPGPHEPQLWILVRAGLRQQGRDIHTTRLRETGSARL